MQKVATVSEIYIFPIKSCAGFKVEKARVTEFGLAFVDNPKISDRKWMVVDENGSFVTQRQLPKMALITPLVSDGCLIITAEGMPELKVSIEPPTEKRNCRCWDSHIVAHSYGNEAGKWLSEFLRKDKLDLVTFSNDVDSRNLAEINNKHAVGVKQTDQVLYADYAPFMLLSEASLNDLNCRLENHVTVRHFRPNILVKDCQAFDEDNWINFKIGNVGFRNIKQGTRCILTTVDPNKGEKDKNEEPLKTLKSYRQNKDKFGVSPLFGINLATDLSHDENIICLNDSVLIKS